MLRSSLHMWMLWLLYTGTFSDEDIIGCEQQPCQNGGVCGSHDDGFRCLCSQQSQNGLLYGGVTCTTALSGCDGNQCENGGVCSPLLINNEHTYSCICFPGFTGPKCQTSTIFSFESPGYMFIETRLQDPEAPLNVTFSFRSERPVGTLLQRRVDDLLLSVELMDSHLRLWSLRGRSSSILVQELPHYVTKNRWHTLEASLSGPVSLIRMICSEGSCTRYSSTEVQLLESAPALPKEPGPVGQSLFIGAGENQGLGRTLDKADQPSTFLGCLRDVFVGSQLLLPHIVTEDAQVNVTVGCSDKDKCADSPCQNRGRCVNRGWRSYICECHRPYEGGSCAEEYITARFGNQDLESYALFSLDDDPGDSVSISMFIRTRQSSGLLLILANSTSQYLRLWLEDGRVKIQVNNFETLTGRAVVSDGHFHLVTVKMKEMEATFIQSTQNQGSIHIRPIQAHHGDLLFVGGLPDSRASASFGGYFKGCVQDLRLNGKRLQFYPIASPGESYSLERLTNVVEGCSSDDVCAVNPCLNGGMCYSMWDNFICNCPPNTAGKRCEEVKWCELSPCPASAVCQPQPQGFDCLANLTFRAESSILHYQNNARINRSLASVSLRFRTRQPAAILLHGQKDSNYLTLSILDSRLVMELQSGAVTDSPKVTIQSQQPVSDGGWHIMELSMENQTLPNSRWIMVVNGCKEELSMSKSATGNLDFLKEGAEIFLGGQNPDTGVKLLGCLGPVEVGGLFFPFHQDTELNLPRPQEEQFMRTNSNTPPLYGCSGAKVCEPNPCKNEGTCEDIFDLHHCTCPSDWTGPLCQDSTNACLSSPCLYGKCTNIPGGFKCVCEAHYSGDQCEVEVDVCLNSNCGNGSTCLKGFETYSCLCPHNLTGQYCDEKLPEIPWYIEINPFPRLPVSLCMGTKWKYSCFNGGNCSEADTCCCLPGFTGQWCEKDVDECASDPCMHGGFCLNYVNTFECVCDMNYSGIHCQVDISDFYLYVFLGLWQNLFQLVSYLVIRLDDEPEIEWGFEVYDD